MAYLNLMLKDIKENKNSRLKEVGVTIKDNHLIIDDVKIANIKKLNNELTFELLIGEFVLRIRFFQKYRDMVNIILKEENSSLDCLSVSNYKDINTKEENIEVKFYKKQPYIISSEISFFNKSDLENIENTNKEEKEKELKIIEDGKWEKWRYENEEEEI